VFVSWTPTDPVAYAYLLGLYLGDGWVAPHLRTARLVVTLDGTIQTSSRTREPPWKHAGRAVQSLC